MDARPETRGHTVAVVGAVVLVASLWLPWYSFLIPQDAIDSVSQLAQQSGSLGPLLNEGAQFASQLGPLHVDSWQVLATVPWLLLVAAAAGGGLSLLAITQRATNVARPAGLAGIAALMLVGYRLWVLPGQGLVHHAWGIWVALAGAALMFAGGAIAERDSAERPADLTLAEFALGGAEAGAGTGWSTAGSPPPPAG